jgi:GDP-D-mannose dehydratase
MCFLLCMTSERKQRGSAIAGLKDLTGVLSMQVREFVEKAFGHVGINVRWEGEPGSVDEIGVDADNPEHVLVKIDSQYFRPTEVGGRLVAERAL